MDSETGKLWAELRRRPPTDRHANIICLSAPHNLNVIEISHVRTAHYAAYRVVTGDSRVWLVRVGVTGTEDGALADNSSFLGTSVHAPTGQRREYDLALGFADAGGQVVAPEHFSVVGVFEVMWVPYITGVSTPLTAGEWASALTSLHRYQPSSELPVFTNRVKTMKRIGELENTSDAAQWAEQYDSQLRTLFTTSTLWSVVHGDAHGGNAINTGSQATLFDFDTACWGPSVWDITHLLNRAGNPENRGFTAQQIVDAHRFDDAEVTAALALRETAATVAHTHHAAREKRLEQNADV